MTEFTSARTIALGLLLLLATSAAPAAAQIANTPDEPPPPGFDGASIIEKPNARVPLDLEFQNEAGEPVRLRDFFQNQRPVLLSMVYFRCPMLCGLTLNGLAKGVKPMKLMPGDDFQIVTVCFDPAGRPGPGSRRRRKNT